VEISYRRFWTTYRSHLYERSVRNYNTLRNNPEERNSHLLRGGSLKSRTTQNISSHILLPAKVNIKIYKHVTLPDACMGVKHGLWY